MNFDFELLDAYKLSFGNTKLFGEYEQFISELGLPEKIIISKNEYLIDSREILNKVISTAKIPNIVTLIYPGINMWYVFNNYIMPSTVDFRKTDKSITYGLIAFSSSYSLEQFKKDFPVSANPEFRFPQSFFEISTGEKGTDFKHFLFKRKSNPNPNAEPLIEFTFEQDKLIYILFANV